MTLSQLEYIMQIYRSGSMNKASQNLFISQSTLSIAIKELEEEIGITIFFRNNRGIALTADGEEFIAKIQPIWEQYREVKQFYVEKELVHDNVLSISTQRYPFCSKAFVEFLNTQDTETYRFGFKESPMEVVIDDVQQGKSEVGIIFVSEMTKKAINRQFSAKKLEFHPLKVIQPHVFLNKNHPLADKALITPYELVEYPYVVYAKQDEVSANFAEEISLSKNINFRKIININDRATFHNILSYTNAFSTGSGVLPNGYCDDRICAVPLDQPAEEMCIGWIKLKNSVLSVKAKAFIDILISNMNEY